MTRFRMIVFLLAVAGAAFAQKSTVPAINAREELREIFRNHPPQLATVLRLDPTLLTNQTYLATYPDLTSFLSQHPEVVHNPAYFLGGASDYEGDVSFRGWHEISGDVAGFTAFLVITGVFIWAIKTLIDQRRWNRLSAVQTEVHSKLLDRFTSNAELLAYLESPSGKKFLESAPIPVESGPKPMSAPVGRIFWSLQIGLVLLAAGIGFITLSARVQGADSTGLYGVGVIALLIGVALVASAGIFYMLSRRFGLFQPTVS